MLLQENNQTGVVMNYIDEFPDPAHPEVFYTSLYHSQGLQLIFYPFIVTFNDVEVAQLKLLPVLTFILAAINTRSITSLSFFLSRI